jgi:hypothetical protein
LKGVGLPTGGLGDVLEETRIFILT